MCKFYINDIGEEKVWICVNVNKVQCLKKEEISLCNT